MNRRNFLESLSAVAAAFALPWKGEDKPKDRGTTTVKIEPVEVRKTIDHSPTVQVIQGPSGKIFMSVTSGASTTVDLRVVGIYADGSTRVL